MDSTTHIYLLRHGETEGGSRFNGSTDVALTKQGLDQMMAAVKNKLNWDHIFSSPLTRCAEFAEKLKQQHNIPLQLDGRIKEIHFGDWEAKSAEEIMADDSDALTRYWQDPTQYTPPQAEALKDFEIRVLSLWNEIIESHPGKKILLVAHGGVIRLLINHVMRRPLSRLLELEVTHASMHGVRLGATGAALIEAKI